MLKRPLNFTPVMAIAVLVLFLAMLPACRPATMQSKPKLLSDPFLQLPTENSVRVVWFTEFPGRHTVAYGQSLNRLAIATTSKLSRVREDQNSRVGAQTEDGQIYKEPIMRGVWRHEAAVTGLTPGSRVPYRVTSEREDGGTVSSAVFSLAPAPAPDTPLKILLTSDHQSMPMTPANLQKVAETMGRVDAIFMAGDLVNIPDRASEWFDDNRGRAFFASLQGRTQAELEKNGVKTVYQGGVLIQHAPLFTVIGNHEVMGRFSMSTSLKDQFNDPIPRAAALYLADQTQPHTGKTGTLPETWLKNHSFNTDTYEEIFTLPTSETGGEKYYAMTFGDVRLVSLYATQIWRTPKLGPEARGKYREREADLNNPANWGYGQHIFEPIKAGSAQYTWLKQELASPTFQKAKYKIVMLHHPIHSLGDNIVPAFTDPQQVIERDENGSIKAIRYEYPLEADYLFHDIQTLLEAAGVQLVLYGHSHLWNRFTSPQGVHFLETSNVGNTYGAYLEKQRKVPTGYDEKYVATGDPNGLEAVVPTIAPLLDQNSKPLSFIASDDITVFSILDTGAGTVSSYRFDTRKPESPVVKFDEFKLSRLA